jgi:hypothetical protein
MTFRLWLQDMWYRHLDELAEFRQTADYDLPTYFNRYKYWLKREYRHQLAKVDKPN